MARNKVEIVNGSTTTVLLDVSGTTATPATVLTGYTFTQADGTQATGTAQAGNNAVETSGYTIEYGVDNEFALVGVSLDNPNTSKTYTMFVTLGGDSSITTCACGTFSYDGTKWVRSGAENVSVGSDKLSTTSSVSNWYWYGTETTFGFSSPENNSSVNFSSYAKLPVITDGITTWYVDEVFNAYFCFVEGTLITLANGTTKAIENITYDDELLTWDFDEGRLGGNKPCWIAKEATAPCYWRVELEDDIVMKLVGANGKCHRLYNHNQRKFMYPQDFKPGDMAMTRHGFVRIKSCEKVNEEVKYYNLMTNYDINCFAEGVLTGNRFCNIYPIDWDMTYIKDDRKPVPREEYAEIPDKIYYGLRLAEQLIQDDREDNVNYYHTMKEHILHNLVEHDKDYTGQADYKKWIFKGGDNK